MTTQKQRPGQQTKLTVNEPGDIYEQEADRAADQVMAAQTHGNMSSAPLQIQRFSDSSYGQGNAAPASVAQTLTSSGRPMEPALRQDMEQRFGYDFSNVRVHTGAAAEQSARDVHARAYTMGHHMVFGAGRFAPETTEGRRLITHELTHVAQMSMFGSPSSLTAALRLPIFRKPESDADSNEEERRRRARSSSAWLDSILWMALGDDPPLLIQWAEKQQSKFEDTQWTVEERLYIAQGLLRVRTRLRELEVRAKHGPDGALVYSYMGDQKPWTQDRARKLDDIAPFTAANIAAWREAAAWQPPVTSVSKRPPRKKTSPQKQPAEPPERPSFAVNITFPKQEGMTFATEEGQRRIAFSLIRSTRSGYTDDQIAWAVSRIDLTKWWAPPGNLDLPTWQKNFEATAIGDKVTMGLSERFTLELDNILTEKPTQHAIQVELGRQAVLSAAPTTYLAYAGPAGLMAGTIIGSGLAFLPGAGTVGGGGLTTGGGGLLAGGEGSLLLGGTIRQSALYAARHLYLNAPRLYGEASFWGGTIVSSVALAEHIREIRERGLRWSDAPRFVQDLFPFFHGNYERYSFRGSSPQTPREGPPVAGPKPIPAKVPAATPPPAPVGPAATAKNPPISFPRRNLIQGPFPAPPATPATPAPARPVTPPVATGRTVAPPASVKPTPPAAPARPPTTPPPQAVVAHAPAKPVPVQPIRPKGFRAWRLGARLKLAIEGVEVSGAAPGIGAGGATNVGRPPPTVIAKTMPPTAAPTPTPPPRTPAPRQVIGPPTAVTPSTPSRATTTGGFVGTPAQAIKPSATTPQAVPAGTGVGIASTRVAGRVEPQPTPISGVAAARGTVGTVAEGTAFTHDQVLDLFVRHFQRPGPEQGTIIFHQTQSGYDAAEQAAGISPGTTLGFFDTNLELVHLPPTVSTLTAMHESLHVISAQSGVEALLGPYVEEGLTEWLARSLGPEAARRVYDDNVAFVRLLANIVGEETLRDAYLHRLWAPLRSALRARLGGDADVEYFYRLLRHVGPEGQNGRFLRDAIDMLWPGSAASAPDATTGSAVIAPVPATQSPGGGTRARREVLPPSSGRQLRPVMELDHAIELGRALVNNSVWLQEIRRISGLEQARRVGEIRDFIKIYSQHSGTTIEVISANQASSYGIGPRNWGTYLPGEDRIVMHEGIFTTPGVNPIREIGHEVGAAELRHVYQLPKDYIPRVVGIGPDLRRRMGGDSLTHVIDTFIKAPD